ncbi:YciI family protein [Paractinoplanes rishiriensis]|uniref:YciI family protein n=1 Tax=Paractinoplanes rishiriensis TaxID=1050105 RepID=UPI001EF2B8CC|nr:YciI family protein [Actinoplanes rishiriensis]
MERSDYGATGSLLGGVFVKYMLMMFGDADDMMAVRSPEWVQGMMAFMGDFNAELEKSGELVEARGLAFPRTAKTVSLVDGQVVVTDGPFAEAKEALAGFWVFDVADEKRAIELAGRVVVWAERVELREVPDGPSEQ